MRKMLRIIDLGNIDVPIGTKIVYRGYIVGRTILSDRKGCCQAAIDSDIIYQLIKQYGVHKNRKVLEVNDGNEIRI